MIDVSDQNRAGYLLLLEMAFQAERCVALVQQALVHGAVGRMTNDATLPQCLVLIHKWAALLRVTLEASFVSAQERETAGFKRLLNICRRAFNGDAFVHFVTIGTAHFAFRYRVMVRQLKRRANFQVALETGLRRLSWINNRTSSAAGFDMQTPWAVARFAPHIHRLLWSFAALCAGLTHDDLLCLQSRVSGCSKVAHDFFVASRAFLRPNKFRPRDARRRKNGSARGAARKQNNGKRGRSSSAPQHGFALTMDPSS